jgi:Mg/Co/Ni transporter MgtE
MTTMRRALRWFFIGLPWWLSSALIGILIGSAIIYAQIGSQSSQGGSTVTANQGTANTFSNAWPILAGASSTAVGTSEATTSAVAASLVVKASAGNLYDWHVTTGATSGYVMVFNLTAAPVNGAVTPVMCYTVGTNSTVGSGPYQPPIPFATGITIEFSSTGCFTATSSATAFIHADFD